MVEKKSNKKKVSGSSDNKKTSSDKKIVENKKLKKNTTSEKESIKKLEKTKNKKETDELLKLQQELFHNWLVIQDFEGTFELFAKNAILYDKQMDHEYKDKYEVTDYLFNYTTYFNENKIKIESDILVENKIYVKLRRVSDNIITLELTLNTSSESDSDSESESKEKSLKISRIELNVIDNNIFENVPNKTYNFRVIEDGPKMNPSTLDENDIDKIVENEKGIVYALLYKLFKAWLLHENMDEVEELISDDCVLHDKEIIMYYNGKFNICRHLYSFITSFRGKEVEVLKYNIIENELYIKVGIENKNIRSDILVRSTIEGNQFCKLVMMKPERDAFKDPLFKNPSFKIDSKYETELIKNDESEDMSNRNKHKFEKIELDSFSEIKNTREKLKKRKSFEKEKLKKKENSNKSKKNNSNDDKLKIDNLKRCKTKKEKF